MVYLFSLCDFGYFKICFFILYYWNNSNFFDYHCNTNNFLDNN